METLDAIGLRHCCDKNSNTHDYLNRYEPLFAPLRNKPINLLEIGVAGGASMRTWLDYFPLAVVFGIDHNSEAVKTQIGDRCNLIHGDVGDKSVWTALSSAIRLYNTGFDIAIDDGAHTTFTIIRAFRLGFGLLKPDGLWIVEDVHACYLPEYNRDNHLIGLHPSITPIDYFKEMVDDEVNDEGESQLGKINERCGIRSITFSKSLIIIRKA